MRKEGVSPAPVAWSSPGQGSRAAWCEWPVGLTPVAMGRPITALVAALREAWLHVGDFLVLPAGASGGEDQARGRLRDPGPWRGPAPGERVMEVSQTV